MFLFVGGYGGWLVVGFGLLLYVFGLLCMV